MAFWIEFFKALPALVELIRELQKAQIEGEVKKKVADDVKTINEAFKTKDADKLNKLFNS
jgi:hypothetical protein